MKKLLFTLTTILAISSFSFAAHANYTLEKSIENKLDLVLSSDSDIYGLQFDLSYDPTQLKLSEEDIAHMFQQGDSRTSMSVYSKIKSPGLARVIMFDFNGQSIITSNNTEKVLSFGVENLQGTLNYTIVIDNVVMAGLHGEEINCSDVETFDFSYSDSALPTETKVIGNYPNPFNPVTTVEFDLSETNQGIVDIAVYDLQGRKVATIFNGYLESGYGYKFNWDASAISSGRYFARVTAPGFTDTINMPLLK